MHRLGSLKNKVSPKLNINIQYFLLKTNRQTNKTPNTSYRMTEKRNSLEINLSYTDMVSLSGNDILNNYYGARDMIH